MGADVQDVARGIGLDNRIGAKFLHAGPGYGGSCFPKDTLALVKTAQDAGAPVRIVETVAAVNDQRKRAMAKKVIAMAGGDEAKAHERLSRGIPMKRIGEPDDVAYCVLYLAADESKFVTGSEFKIDGGMLAQ